MGTTIDKLGCECGFTCDRAGEMYHHRKDVHGDDGSVAYAFAGTQVSRQNSLKKALRKEGVAEMAEVDEEVQTRLRRKPKRVSA